MIITTSLLLISLSAAVVNTQLLNWIQVERDLLQTAQPPHASGQIALLTQLSSSSKTCAIPLLHDKQNWSMG